MNVLQPFFENSLRRDLRRAAAEHYDLCIVGGGIQGAALALEASRRGISTLLLERGDFGGATTWNSLRIVHGGLRYLQNLDLSRFRESDRERRWLLRCFPDLVKPLPCLMPLYDPPRGGWLRRRLAFRAAFAAEARLGRRPREGEILSAAEVRKRFPSVDPAGLRGGALWYDAAVPDSQRLVVEMLRWASHCGARVLNYVEATGLRVEQGKVAAVEALDHVTDAALEFSVSAVVNCAGPWCRAVSRRFDRDLPSLFRPVLALNVFLDREPLAQEALAVAPPRRGAPTFFLLPWKKRLLAGTAYAAAKDLVSGPEPARVAAFLEGLNSALPGFGAAGDQILRVHWGWLPGGAHRPAVPASRPIVHLHASHGGPGGLASVSGVKLTTARAVAERALRLLFSKLPGEMDGPERPPADPPLPFDALVWLSERDWASAQSHVQGLVERQAVVRLDDLLLRRTDWGIFPERFQTAERLCGSLGWNGRIPEPVRIAAGW